MEKLLVFNLYQVSCPELTWHPPCVSYNAHENEIYYEMPENFQFYIVDNTTIVNTPSFRLHVNS